MAIFIRLGNLTQQGRSNIIALPQILQDIAKVTKDMGASTLHTYVSLGRYDTVSIIEAPDHKTAAAISAKITAMGDLIVETLAAVDIEELVSIMQSKHNV